VDAMFYHRNLLIKITNNFLGNGKCTYSNTAKDQGSTMIKAEALLKKHKQKEIKYSCFEIVVQ
jgi:hypothetical protein